MERKGKRSYSTMSNASTVVLPRFGRAVRTYKKRKFAKRVRNVVPFGAKFPPGRAITHLRYALIASNNDTAIDDNVIRLNSTFDPELTQSGHQPMGRDQMITLYGRYLVTKVSCDWVVQAAGSAANNLLITLVPSNDATVFTTLAAAMEQAGSKTVAVNTGFPAKFRTVYYPHKITGVSKTKYKSDDLFSSVVGGDPSEVIVLHIVMGTANGAGVTDASITASAVLTYTTEWFDPVQLGLS